MITEIVIKNFRSISSATINADRITTFVGSNDAGKSNILRALNLFFNGETGHGEPFDFAKDYNIFARKGQKKAPEIEIKITFKLPRSYIREEYPDAVEWKKVWRVSGEVDTKRSFFYLGGVPFPPKSRIPALMDRVVYTYIPAIKDEKFFGDLQGRLYDVLSSVAAEPLKRSATQFEDQLQFQLKDLLDSMQNIFNGAAAMKLPENLREIFENLEISSGNIPLSRRGDGIKIRNIPMILQFIAEKQDQILNRGGIRYTHLWGFEEPENNVEMSAAFTMAQALYDTISTHENFQLIMTTHSPIFYKMPVPEKADDGFISTNFVERINNQTVVANRDAGEVDITMGLMPLLSPYLEDAKKEYDTLKAQLKTAHNMAAQKMPTAFVEGPTDKTILTLAWLLFAKEPQRQINFHDGGAHGYGSASALASRSLAWLLEMRHRSLTDVVPAVAIFDADEAGKSGKKELAEKKKAVGINNETKFSSHFYPQSKRIQELTAAGFVIAADLESLYSDVIWETADKNGWLEEHGSLHTRLKTDTLQSMMKNEIENPFMTLGGSDNLRVCKKFTDVGKTRVAKHLQKMEQTKLKDALQNLESFILKIEASLFM